jgi:CRP-like cAMP-binding protein
MPLPVRNLSGTAAPPAPTVRGRPIDPRRGKASTAPPPLIRGTPRRTSLMPAITRPQAELPLSPLSSPLRGQGQVDEEAPTRVADRLIPSSDRTPPGGRSPSGMARPLAPPERAIASAPPRRARPPLVAADTLGGETRVAQTGATELERLARALDGTDEPVEATIVDDGLALARVLSPSVVTQGEKPELAMLRGMPERAVNAIAAGMTRRQAHAGEMVVREGDRGDACYVVVRGELRVLKRDPLNPRGELVEIGVLGEGAFFGEIALLPERRRLATVQAVGDVEYFAIPRALLRQVSRDVPEVEAFLMRFYRERLLANLVASATFFTPLAETARADLVKHFQLQRFGPRSQIVSEGRRAGGFYLVVLGALEITRAVTSDRSVLVASLGEGAYFGEMSLLRGDVARASVATVGITELAMLPPKNFYALVASNPSLWDEVRKEARRRELESLQVLVGQTTSL